jgi:excisionase family DNA binding protein
MDKIGAADYIDGMSNTTGPSSGDEMHDSGPDHLISIREAAAICCVSRNTVMRWIQAGKLPAEKLPGNRYRVHRADLNRLMLAGGIKRIEQVEPGFFQYCWEYNSKSGKVNIGCKKCVVYRTRSGRCYEIASQAGETGHARIFCKNSCEECDYYKKVKGLRPSVLAVTCDDKLKSSLRNAVEQAGLDFKSTDCEYKCLMLLDRFLPDFVIIDCSLGDERSRDFAEMLWADSRVPYVKIILIGEVDHLPNECDKITFAFLERNFTLGQIEKLLILTPAPA